MHVSGVEYAREAVRKDVLNQAYHTGFGRNIACTVEIALKSVPQGPLNGAGDMMQEQKKQQEMKVYFFPAPAYDKRKVRVLRPGDCKGKI